jgi:hypothetical protein
MVVAVLAGMVWLDNRQLEQRVDDLRAQHDATLRDLEGARQAEQSAQSALAAQGTTLATLQTEVTALRSQLEHASESTPSQRKAVRAQVYAGRQLLGDGWVFVGGAETNEAAAVSLDERVLRTLVERAAKEVAATETPREITVNHNYANSPYWGSYWPVAWGGWSDYPPSTNRPPAGGISPPPSTLPPPSGGGSGAGGIWRPTQRPFLPNPSPWPGVTPPSRNPIPSPRVNPALPATQPVLLPRR